MDKYTRDTELRGKGINGVRIIPKDSIPRTKRVVEHEKYVGPGNGDLRRYRTFGAIMPLEDYMVSGVGRPPIVIREVGSEIKKMKKYALLNFNRSTEYANVRYVYSEGIDIERMVEDEEYAEAVISLLQELRLKQKEEQSYELQSDTVYIGTIEAAEKGYRKAGINDYATAVSMIDAGKREAEEAARRAYQRTIEEEDILPVEKERMDELFAGLDDKQIDYLFGKICDKKGEKGPIGPQIAEMLKGYFKQKDEKKTAKPSLDENDGDEEPEQ